jgi:Fe2+ or Zn2+ uptake regulation protein
VNQNGASPDSLTDAEVNLRALVLAYLDDHPTAMDTIDGIAEWWILRQQIDIEVRRVSRVLALLVTEGVLEEVNQSGLRFYRRRATTARPHIAAWPGSPK